MLEDEYIVISVLKQTFLRRIYIHVLYHGKLHSLLMLHQVPVQLDSRSVNTLMEIQRGSGPFASPATGYVYMGDDTSVVIYVQGM